MCYPCLRTPVTYVSGLYKGERGGFSFYCWLLTVGYPSALDTEP
jgi:hypothetical protein